MKKNKLLMKSGPYEIRAAGDNKTELLVYGDIGATWYGDGVAAQDIVETLQEITTEEIVVRLNSYGGSVTEGLAIYNALKRSAALVTVSVDGVAYSIASLIAMAGDTVEMAPNTLMMIHAPWGGSMGNSKVMREYADILDKYAEAMISSYTSKSGMSADDVRALLTDGVDHFYTAQEAIDAGFADVIAGEAVDIAASGFDLSRFQQPPAAAAASQKPKPKIKPVQVIPQNEETPMTEEEKNAAAKAEKDKIVAKALEANAARTAAIRASFKPFIGNHGVQAMLDVCVDDTTMTPEAAREKLLAHLGASAEPLNNGVRIETGADEREKFLVGASASIAARANLGADEAANEYRGFSMLELARKSLEISGTPTARMGKMEVVAAAFTSGTSDFTQLLANNANKAMLRGYEEAEETFQLWTMPGELPDFKTGLRVGLNDFASLREVKPGGEYKYIYVDERSEPIVLATYGEKFSIDRQAIINDDLNAFTRVPRKLGGSAIRTIGDLVYAILTGNPNMSDGVALFHATHGNLPTASVPYTASLDAMRVAMAKQTAGGKALNIRMKHIICPVALEGAMRVIRDSEKEVTSAKTAQTPNSMRGTFDVISDARLDTASATAWYGTADQGIVDTIEVAYLDGQQSPFLEQQLGWDVDGVEFKVRMDAGVSPLDYRGMAKNTG